MRKLVVACAFALGLLGISAAAQAGQWIDPFTPTAISRTDTGFLVWGDLQDAENCGISNQFFVPSLDERLFSLAVTAVTARMRLHVYTQGCETVLWWNATPMPRVNPLGFMLLAN